MPRTNSSTVKPSLTNAEWTSLRTDLLSLARRLRSPDPEEVVGAVILAMLEPRDDADDPRCTAEKFQLEVLRKIAMRSVRNRVISDWRREKARSKPSYVANVADMCGAGAETPSPATAAVERIHACQTLEALRPVLRPEYTSVLGLTFVHGLTSPEAAETLGVRPGTVQSRIHRARAAVRAATLPGGDVTISVSTRLLPDAQLELPLTRTGS